jgi:hypothetical protein
LINTPSRQRLQSWVQDLASNREVPWEEIPLYLGWNCSINAISTAMAILHYRRRIQRRVPPCIPQTVGQRLNWCLTSQFFTLEQ